MSLESALAMAVDYKCENVVVWSQKEVSLSDVCSLFLIPTWG